MTEPRERQTRAMNQTHDAIVLLQKSVEQAEQLRVDVREYNRARKRDSWGMIGMTILVFVVLLANVIVIFQIRDCTSPTGTCAQRSRERMSEAILEISRQNTKGFVYVSQCSRLYPGISGPEYDAKIEACVVKRLAENRPLGSPR